MSDREDSVVDEAHIQDYIHADAATCADLWNVCCAGPHALVYKPLSPEEFGRLFEPGTRGFAVINLVARIGREIVGFASGTVREGGDQGYVTVVLVREDLRRRGIGSEMLARLEQRLAEREPRIDRYEVMFFNPVNVSWFVPGTDGHDHPNAPGIDVACDGYPFLKNQGYRDNAFQSSYYLPLADYRLPPDMEQTTARLAAKGVRIVRYEPDRHEGLDELLDDLQNDDWREILCANHAAGGPADPVLIVEANDRVRGFAGPVRVQPSGRGYFAGIGVHSAIRRRGAGKALFSALCVQLKESGASFMTLFTGETNPARSIYEAAGFKIVRTWANLRKAK